MMDFTNPDILKDRTDSEILYLIKNGHHDIPAEGPRAKNEEAWGPGEPRPRLRKKKTLSEKHVAKPLVLRAPEKSGELFFIRFGEAWLPTDRPGPRSTGPRSRADSPKPLG